ncbi:MAG: Ferric reductase like transmembrane component [Chloroflexi bacterium ADurb.Bin180]|nr:MAG: Ferric reductase like transmembrane component [Chloroflexi bacterium ADurb.Bin180]HNR95742.1 ferric reductase-like transmembrane domain-containing protein [Anaerolineae bacterium]HNT05496.1 ferric reductase-like transmembrane domain-containing protein [Anaerolineae bacterium]
MDEKTVRLVRSALQWFVELTVIIIILTLWNTPSSGALNLARAAGLIGYIALFLAILSFEFVTEMTQLYGRPYLAVHHWLAFAGLGLALLHALAMAGMERDSSVLVPRLGSLRTFLTFGGPPALYLLLIAAAAGFLRGRIGSSWKYIHWLNYAAFFLILAHSWLRGTNVPQGILSVLWPAMALIVLVVFVHKHLLRKGRPAS